VAFWLIGSTDTALVICIGKNFPVKFGGFKNTSYLCASEKK
jgi:hypothetical protein